MTSAQLMAAAIAAATFAALAVGKAPRLRLNRASIALVGAGAVLVTGIVPFHAALELIDLGTIFLLLSMMVINAVLELAGFFTQVGQLVIEHALSPFMLLALVIVVIWL